VVNGLDWGAGGGDMASMGEDRNVHSVKANLYLCPPLRHTRSGGSALLVSSSWKPHITNG